MSYTNTTRILGINSGMDTETLISNLMKAESMKLQRTQRNFISLQWKQEAYRSVYTNLSSFQTKFLDLTSATSFRMPGIFTSKSQTVKTSAGQDSNAVTLGSGAKDGTYSVKIDRLAEADLYESTSKIGGNISSKAGFQFDVSNIREGATYEITLDGSTKSISFSKGDVESLSDENDFINLLNNKLKDAFGMEGTGSKQKVEAKLTASGGLSISTNGYHTGFSIADGRYLPSTATAENDGEFTDGKANSDKTLAFEITYGASKKTISVDVTEGMSKEEIVDALNEELKSKSLSSRMQFALDDGKIKLNGGSLTNNLEIKSSESEAGSMEYLGFDSDNAVTLPPTSSLAGIGITSGSAAKFKQESTLKGIFGDNLTGEKSFTINGKEFSFTSSTKMSDLINEVNEAGLGVKLRYDEYNEVFQLESDNTGYANKINMSGEFLTDNLGFGTSAKRSATDSVATINGTTLTRAENHYEFEGVDWTLNRVTEGDTLTVEVSRNVDSIVDNIKSFVDSYNELVGKLTEMSTAARPKTNGSYGSYYEPLLDEEKAEMTEDQIAKWEENAKTGLMRRDSLITGIAQQLRTSLYQAVPLEDGSHISLFEIGITTSSSWHDGGKLIIDEEKLRKAISERGDDVMNLFSKGPTDTADRNTRFSSEGLAFRMNDIITEAVRPNGTIADKAGIEGFRSETDNMIYKQMRVESDKINLMYQRLADKENYYYSLFARMETSIAKSNSQMSYLMSLGGGGM